MPTHPGDVVKEELEARGISQKEFASRTGISYTMLNEILNSKRPITSEIALVIEAALGINPELLINMQSRYNMVQARMKPAIESNLAHIRKVCASWLLQTIGWYDTRIKTLYPKTRIHITQKTLAEQIEKKREYISALEKGQTDMQLSTFISIADALGLRFSLV